MASIRKRTTAAGERRYYVEVRLRGHPAVRNTFHNLVAARDWARSVEDDIRAGKLLARREGYTRTLADAIRRYDQDHAPQLADAQAIRDRRAHLAWWEARLGVWTLADLTPGKVSDARRELLATVSGATSNRYLAALSAVLSLAAGEWEWLERNPCASVRRMRENPGRVRFLSVEERDRLLAACAVSDDRRLYPLVLFALATGARQGELVALRWRDIDTVAGRAVLERTKNRDRRALHFHGRALAVLRELSKTPSITGYLFAGRHGEPSFPLHAWHVAVRDSDLQDFRFHDLRHTAASYLAMSGATLAELAEFLGHRSLAMVRRYAHLTEQHSAGVSARMAERFLA